MWSYTDGGKGGEQRDENRMVELKAGVDRSAGLGESFPPRHQRVFELVWEDTFKDFLTGKLGQHRMVGDREDGKRREHQEGCEGQGGSSAAVESPQSQVSRWQRVHG